MHLYFFLLVIISLSAGTLPPGEIAPPKAAVATAMMVAAWILLSHLAARVCALQVRREKVDPLQAAQWMERQLSIFRWLGLAVVVLCLAGFGLARSLDSTPLLSESMVLQALILLAPGIAITAGTWSAEHCYGAMLGYTDKTAQNYIRSLADMFRGNFGWLVLPILLLLAVSDAVAWLPVSSAVAGTITAASILLFVPLGLPWLIRHLFKTSRLDPETEQWIEQLMTAVGLKQTRLLRWETHHRSFNALVAGFVPPLRTLLLSDRLLDELPRSQIAMVVLHEAAHLKRRHVPMRMLAVLPAWGIGALLSRILGPQSWSMAAGSVVGIVLTMVILRLVAWKTEYDADLQACRMATQASTQVSDVPCHYDEAADALAAALLRVTFDHPESRKATWLHPGIAQRINWMRRHRAAPHSNTATAGTIANPA